MQEEKNELHNIFLYDVMLVEDDTVLTVAAKWRMLVGTLQV